MSPRPITATYRLQLHAGFGFAAAERIVPYLAALGVSHLYLSPIFTARPGSTHGYDVVDPQAINPELGGEDGFRQLAAAAQVAGLGIILDIVPNHMATHADNAAWMDVLAHGRASRWAATFDIDWRAGPITLPVLGDSLDAVLSRGEITIDTDEASGLRMARYYDHAFPIRPDRHEGSKPLADILAEQHWQLVPWQQAAVALGYRRFFNISELIGVRVEDEAVFEAVHRLPLGLLAEGLVDGLRVDHVDGLADPAAYCRRLRQAAGPDALIVVEKILEGDEGLRDWSIDGTTGYDRLNDINGLFLDEDGARRLDAYLVGAGLLQGDATQRLRQAKRQVLDEMFGGEVTRLARLAAGIAPDLPAEALREAAVALLVHCPTYRSYASPRGHGPEDEALWAAISASIRAHEPAAVADAVEVIVAALGADAALDFATAFQQLAGPAMAKGLEDTEFYRSIGLLAANEVGADLAHPVMAIERFHRRNEAAVAQRDLVPLATHDTKRGPDTRARLGLISLDPERFIAAYERWSGMAAALRRAPDAPDSLDLWLMLQTLAGAMPISADRLAAYLEKAMREAKRHSRWEAPAEPYEAATTGLARAIVDDPAGEALRADIAAFVAAAEEDARLASLCQTVLQLTVPGISDIYQGTELWDHSLVDPDNRRPVDWIAREEALAGGIVPPPCDDGLGLTKFHVLRRLLALRRTHPALFVGGAYRPVAAVEGAARWLAFERRHDDVRLLVAVPTRVTRLGAEPLVEGLPPGPWRNAIDDHTFELRSGTMRVDRRAPFVVALAEGG